MPKMKINHLLFLRCLNKYDNNVIYVNFLIRFPLFMYLYIYLLFYLFIFTFHNIFIFLLLKLYNAKK